MKTHFFAIPSGNAVAMIASLSIAVPITTLAQTHSSPAALNIVNVARYDNNMKYADIGDVWGLNTDSKHYVLATMRRDGEEGLAVIDATDPYSPVEKLFVNLRRQHVDEFGTVDVETYEMSETVYAYVARDRGRIEVINLTGALNSGSPSVTVNDPWVGAPIDRLGTPANPYPAGSTENRFARTHTLNIAGDYLYVGSQTRYVDVWHLGSNPMQPSKVGVVEFTVPIGTNRLLGETLMADPNTHGDSVSVRLPTAHELFARSTGAYTARLYLAFSHGGLHVADVNLQQGTSPADEYNNYIHKSFHVRQLYDRDRLYPTQIQSGDNLDDWRGTHSAWPTDDGAYVFTTDEANYPQDSNIDLAFDAYPPNWARADSITGIWEVTDPNKPRLSGYDMFRRDGAFVRIWKTSELGTVESTAYVELVASNTIKIDGPFHAKLGSRFSAEIDPYLAASYVAGGPGSGPRLDGTAGKSDVEPGADEYTLDQNYPNPFNPLTTIQFFLPRPDHVRLVVYDLTGPEVARLIDGRLEAGQHEVRWDASILATGVYLYRLTASSFSRTQRMTLVK